MVTHATILFFDIMIDSFFIVFDILADLFYIIFGFSPLSILLRSLLGFGLLKAYPQQCNKYIPNRLMQFFREEARYHSNFWNSIAIILILSASQSLSYFFWVFVGRTFIDACLEWLDDLLYDRFRTLYHFKNFCANTFQAFYMKVVWVLHVLRNDRSEENMNEVVYYFCGFCCFVAAFWAVRWIHQKSVEHQSTLKTQHDAALARLPAPPTKDQRLEAHNKGLRADLKKEKNEKTDLQRDLQNEQKAKSDLHQELQKETDEKSELLSTIKSQDEQYISVSAQLVNAEDEIDRLNVTLRQQKTAFDGRYASAVKARDQFKQKCQALAQKAVSNESQAVVLASSRVVAPPPSRLLAASYARTPIYSTLQANNDSLRRELAEVKREHGISTQNINSYKIQAEYAQHQLLLEQQASQKLQEKYSDLKQFQTAKPSNKTQGAVVVYNDEVAALKAEVKKLQEKNKTMSAKQEKSRKASSTRDEKLRMSEEQCQALQSQHNECLEELKKAKISATEVKEENIKLTNAIEATYKASAASSISEADLRTLSDAKQKVANAEQTAVAAEEKVVEAQHELSAANEKSAAAQDAAQQMKQTAAIAEARAASAEAKVTEAEQEASKLIQEVEAAISRATTAEAAKKEVEAQKLQLETEAKEWKTGQEQETQTQIEAEKAKIKAEAEQYIKEEVQKACKNASEAHQSLQNELQQTQSLLADLQKETEEHVCQGFFPDQWGGYARRTREGSCLGREIPEYPVAYPECSEREKEAGAPR